LFDRSGLTDLRRLACLRLRSSIVVASLVLAGGGQQVLMSSAAHYGRAATLRAAARSGRAPGAAARLVMKPAAAALEHQVFDLVNEQRTAHGLKPLIWDEQLYRMARRQAESMGQLNYFDHKGPDGMGVVKRAQAAGVTGWRTLGENIGYILGSADPATTVVREWLRSKKHCAILLYRSFTHGALGVAEGPDGRIFFTQVFAEKR
jgi:uncharacterized protein YkwD